MSRNCIRPPRFRADLAQNREHVEAAQSDVELSEIKECETGAVTAVPTDGIDAAGPKETESSVCVAVL